MQDPRISALEKQLELLECTHPKWDIRYVEASNGLRMFCRQCTRCGERKDMWIPHAKVENKDGAKPVDDALRFRYRESLHELKTEIVRYKSEVERKEEKSEFDSWYNNYLNSPEWYEKRALVLKRCHYICEGCNKAKATVVHHLNYKNVGNEFLFELVGLCRKCHERYHNVEGVEHEQQAIF